MGPNSGLLGVWHLLVGLIAYQKRRSLFFIVVKFFVIVGLFVAVGDPILGDKSTQRSLAGVFQDSLNFFVDLVVDYPLLLHYVVDLTLPEILDIGYLLGGQSYNVMFVFYSAADFTNLEERST